MSGRPANRALARSLELALEFPVDSLVRSRNQNHGGAPSEFASCLAGGRQFRLFIKYEPTTHGRPLPTTDLASEAAAYRDVLQPLGYHKPRFYGFHHNNSGRWLIFEQLDDCEILDDISDTDSMCLAAAWLGTFHRRAEALVARQPAAGLKTYGLWDYLRVAEKALDRVPSACEYFVDQAASLCTGHPTVIHGDYYAHNILMRDGAVIPIDWENAAIAAGEIDLANLTDGWDDDTTRAAITTYLEARWPASQLPRGFDANLSLARIYVHLDWLGNIDWPPGPEEAWRIARLEAIVGAVGIRE